VADPITRVLDVGVGAGGYSTAFRQGTSNAEWVGIEVWGPYVDQFDLHGKYDKIILSDVRWISFEKLGKFDICFCGDILEHMSLEDAQAVIRALVQCSKVVFASVPLGHCPQEPKFDNPFERHIVDDYSDETFRAAFPDIIDGVSETEGIWTLGAYALSKQADVCARLRALRRHDAI
jgi:hypothetical protein